MENSAPQWPEIVTAISTVVVAIAALGVSVWQGIVSRRHNRLSVTPQLRFDFHITDDALELTLINTGVGPAIIEKLVAKVDGKDVERYPFFYAAIDKLGVGDITWFAYTPYECETMAAGEKIVLINTVGVNNSNRQRIRKAFLRLEIQVLYKSIYGESFTLAWNIESAWLASALRGT